MGLHQTLQQILEAREAATESAAQMRQHERAVAAMLDRIERATASAWWERLFVGGIAGLVGGLVVAVVLLWLL